MKYKLTRFSPVNLSSLTQLLNQAFGIKGDNKDEVINWKYFHSFHNNNTCSYLALDENKVISVYTNFPIEITYLSKSYNSFICADMATDERYRGQGLISQLSKMVYLEIVNKKNVLCTIGFSNDQGIKVDKNSRNYGYQIVGKIVRYIGIPFFTQKSPFVLSKVTDFSKSFKFTQDTYICINKNYEYLNWRYVQKPNSMYDIFQILEGDKLLGYVVLKIIDNKCYVLDIILSNFSKNIITDVIRSIELKAIELKSHFIIHNVLDTKFWESIFNKFRYFKKTQSKRNHYLTIKIHNKQIPPDILTNKENWLILNGDIL